MTRLAVRTPHPQQCKLVYPPAKFAIYRIGRRWGKTTGASILALQRFHSGIRSFLKGGSGDIGRVLYAGPTSEQTDAFWTEIKMAVHDMVEDRFLYLNETKRFVELHRRVIRAVSSGYKPSMRIKAKTAFNADTLRGDWGGLLILDEFQLMNEDAWATIGEPMLLDVDGDAVFLYTPPHPHSRSMSKATDKLHAAKMYKEKRDDPEWFCMHSSSFDNPHLPRSGLERTRRQMSSQAFEMEIMARDLDQAPGALWTWDLFHNDQRRAMELDTMMRVVVGVDPSGTRQGSECGIIVAGIDRQGNGQVLADLSGRMSASQWGETVVKAYDDYKADRVVAEVNFGGDMVQHTIRVANREVGAHAEIPVRMVNASRGKAPRAEPVSALYQHGRVFHQRAFQDLEEQLCMWEPQDTWSPDRMDALVWALTDLMLDRDKGRASAVGQPSREMIRSARQRRRRR